MPIDLAGKDWLLPAALMLAAGLAAVVWAYHRAPADGRVRGICMGLKILGLILLLLCLLNPMITAERAKPGANLLALLADNSEGLQLTDDGEKTSRAQTMADSLKTAPNGWLARLDNDFDVKRYTFGQRLRRVEQFNSLAFNEPASRLGGSLKTLARRFHGQPLAGIVVFTDGVATDLEADLAAMEKLPPVYPVVIGRNPPARDVAIAKITATQSAFEDAPVTIMAQVNATGCKGETIGAKLELLDSKGQPARTVAEKSLPAGDPDAPLLFRFQVRPTMRGILVYRLTVKSNVEGAEATLANNQRMVMVDRGGGPYRVLYVSGRANWEYKFLSRALAADEQVDLVGLIRLAKQEPKFAFKGRAGENSNPLFRGFGDKNQDTEFYDKPVLMRLNTRDAEELKTGFPTEASELFGYNAVVIDDLESAFFTVRQQRLLHEFVSERGGGLLMLGGQESFRQGDYSRTPIGNLLPVYLTRPTTQPAQRAQWKMGFTREGWLQPWARLRDNEADERARLSELPGFVSLNTVRGAKPGASVLATVQMENNPPRPALATHNFGRGRVAAVLLGDVWRWGMKDAALHEDMDKAWRQMIRWLVADVPAAFELSTLPATEGPSRNLVVHALNPEFKPLDNANISLRVRRLGATNSVPLQAEAAAENAGVYKAQYLPRKAGAYLATAEVREESGKLLGRRQAGWITDPAAAEYRSLAPNRALLENLANKTGGRVIELEELETFAASLPSQRAPITEMHRQPLWHQGPLFLIALACFVAEWFIRRRKGLP